MTDSERIKEIRKALKKNQEDFAAEFGIQQNTYSSYETGAKEWPKNFIRILKTEYSINPEWWEKGIGPIFIEKGIIEKDKLTKQKGIPYYDIDVTAGNVIVFNG